MYKTFSWGVQVQILPTPRKSATARRPTVAFGFCVEFSACRPGRRRRCRRSSPDNAKKSSGRPTTSTAAAADAAACRCSAAFAGRGARTCGRSPFPSNDACRARRPDVCREQFRSRSLACPPPISPLLLSLSRYFCCYLLPRSLHGG